jgi:two-component system, LuxR family, sensor kinase FixL
VTQAANDLQAVLDAAVDAVIVIDHHGRITTFNHAAERLFGYPAAEALGLNIAALMAEPHGVSHDNYVRSYLETGRARIIGVGRDVWAKRRDGSLFPAALSVGQIKGEGPPRFVGFIHDVTLRRAAIDALRQERDRAQNYLDLVEVMLLAVDRRGSITLINRKGEEIIGRTADELIGHDWFEQCVPDEHRLEERRRFDAALEDPRGAPAHFETTIVTQDGQRKLIAWNVTTLRDEHGMVIGQLSSGEDVTARRRAETALQRSEALLRSAQAIANLGTYEIDLSSDKVAWSTQMYEILGRDSTSQPLNIDVFVRECVHPDDRERFEREWRLFREATGRLDVELRIVRPNGTVRFVNALATVQRRSDAWAVITGTLHDVTERKLAEQDARIGQERLTHVARLSTMGEMATGLAHEINQPLTAISTYAQAAVRLMDAPGGADPADLREVLVQITSQSLRAGEVIRRLRSFVKHKGSSAEKIDINLLVEDVRVLAETDARLHDIRILLDLAPGLPIIIADSVQLQQVMLNLIRNAIDAINEKADAPRKVTIRTYHIEDGIEVEVIDRAHGIPDHVAENLFNPFYTTKQNGTGLGLAISRSIITAHKGKLGHRQTPGGGTTFYFTLPQAPGEQR